MGDISKNISRSEIKCRCGECNYGFVDAETVMAVQFACNHFADKLGVKKVTLLITGGARCPAHNAKVGGADSSYHLNGAAMDHTIKGVANSELAEFYRANYPNKFGVGEYDSFVHLDARSSAARWRG